MKFELTKKLFYILFLCAALLVVAHDQRASAEEATNQIQYFSLIPDVPLMSGLREITDEAMFFDKPEGRIIEVYALLEGITRQDVLVYYRGTLPQLGWTMDGPNRFFRKDEFLDIAFESNLNSEILRLMVRPSL